MDLAVGRVPFLDTPDQQWVPWKPEVLCSPSQITPVLAKYSQAQKHHQL